MKYNDPIKNDENEAHNIIMNKIVPGSTVLEFGAANGRMTRILRNVMGCRVYIVEIDEESYAEAIQYAEAGICDDINTLLWKKWSDIRFDYIIFADVLEHLIDPYIILDETYDLLKDDGSVLISIPNVAHNDVWAKLYLNHFDYTNIGILDNTHLHFFAEENLLEFEKHSRYKIVSRDYKTVPTLTSEQFLEDRVHIPEEIMQLMYTRKNGQVYQFILEMKKEFCADTLHLTKAADIYPDWVARIYFGRGKGYTQEDGCDAKGVCDSEGNIIMDLSLELPMDVSTIRIDPIEGVPCLLKYISVEGGKITGYNSEELVTDQGVILFTADPQILCEVESRKIKVKLVFIHGYNKICSVLYSWGKRLEQIQLLQTQMREDKQTLVGTLENVENQCIHTRILIETLREEGLEHRISLEKQNAILEEKNHDLEEKNNDLEEQINAIEGRNSSLMEENDLLKEKTVEMAGTISNLEQTVLGIKNRIARIESSKWWKIRCFFRKD